MISYNRQVLPIVYGVSMLSRVSKKYEYNSDRSDIDAEMHLFNLSLNLLIYWLVFAQYLDLLSRYYWTVDNANQPRFAGRSYHLT